MVIKVSREKVFCFLLCAYINILPLMDTVSNILIFMNKSFIHKNLIQIGLYLIFFILIILTNNRSFTSGQIERLFAIVAVSFVCFFVSWRITPDIGPILIHSYILFLMLVVFTSFFVCQVQDYGMFIHTFELFYPMIIVYSIFTILVKNRIAHGYSMNYSYNSFFVSGIALLMGMVQKNPLKIGIFAFILATDIVAGARGALLCDVLLFVFTFIYFNHQKRYSARIVGVLIALIVGMVSLMGIPIMARLLYTKFSSRTLELLGRGSIHILSGREIYYQSIIKEILRNPIAMHGVLADRVFMAGVRGLSINGENMTAYAHNFILEIIFQFGVILGAPVALVSIHQILRGMIQTIRDSEKQQAFSLFYILTFSYAVGQLMFSNSYLISSSAGLLFASVMVIKYRNIKEEVLA